MYKKCYLKLIQNFQVPQGYLVTSFCIELYDIVKKPYRDVLFDHVIL